LSIMRIRAALLDMDGTVFDSRIDWLRLREKIELPWDGRPILAQLGDAPPDVRAKGLALLHEAERVGAENGDLIPGAHEILECLRRHSVRCVLITNNSRRSAETVLRRCRLSFELVLTRDDGPTKPDPEAFVRALAQLQVEPRDAVAIGDAHLDLIAAQRAGIGEIILVGTPPWMREHIPPDADYHAAANLLEAREILERLLAAPLQERR
jgi:HAD superfamily hydrolase (TIGR01509 family)